jgi:hypothetical protein
MFHRIEDPFMYSELPDVMRMQVEAAADNDYCLDLCDDDWYGPDDAEEDTDD